MRLPKGLTHQPIPGDGHCLYHAVAIYTNDGDQQGLRNRVANHIADHLVHFQGFIPLMAGQTIEQYIVDIRSGREWASHIEIMALMRVLNQPIVIIGPDGRIRNRGDIEGFDLNHPIFVYYNDHNHYDALVIAENHLNQGRRIFEELLHQETHFDEQAQILVGPGAATAHNISSNQAIRSNRNLRRRLSLSQQGIPEGYSPGLYENPLEQISFSTFVIDNLNQRPLPVNTLLDEGNIVKLDLTRLFPTEADANNFVGFSNVETAYRMTYRQGWYAKDLALGRLIHTMPLAPGEIVRYAITDWTRSERGERHEEITDQEKLDAAASHVRDINEISNAVANSTSSAFSSTSSQSSSEQSGGGGGFSFFGLFGGGGSVSSSSSNSQATSFSRATTSQNFAASMSQRITDSTNQHASSFRNRTASVIQEKTEREQQGASSRIVGNFNHMHTLTLQYYQVVQIFSIVLSLASVEKCLLVPFQAITFTERVAETFWYPLSQAALNKRIKYQIIEHFGNEELLPPPPVPAQPGVQPAAQPAVPPPVPAQPAAQPAVPRRRPRVQEETYIRGQSTSQQVIAHLNNQRLHYSYAVFASLGPAPMLALLSQYIYDGHSLAAVVNPVPIGIFGNMLAFVHSGLYPSVKELDVVNPEISGTDDEKAITNWMKARNLKFGKQNETLMPLPTHGVAVEGVLGRCNTGEGIDLTRFWNWQESPPVVLPPDIAAIQLQTRAQGANLAPTPMPSPVLQQQPAVSLPNPITNFVPAASAFFQQNPLAELTQQMAQTGQLAATGITATQSGAAQAGNTAHAFYQTTAETQVQLTEIMADAQVRTAEVAGRIVAAAYGVPGAATVTSEGGRHNLNRQRQQPSLRIGDNSTGVFNNPRQLAPGGAVRQLPAAEAYYPNQLAPAQQSLPVQLAAAQQGQPIQLAAAQQGQPVAVPAVVPPPADNPARQQYAENYARQNITTTVGSAVGAVAATAVIADRIITEIRNNPQARTLIPFLLVTPGAIEAVVIGAGIAVGVAGIAGYIANRLRLIEGEARYDAEHPQPMQLQLRPQPVPQNQPPQSSGPAPRPGNAT